MYRELSWGGGLNIVMAVIKILQCLRLVRLRQVQKGRVRKAVRIQVVCQVLPSGFRAEVGHWELLVNLLRCYCFPLKQRETLAGD